VFTGQRLAEQLVAGTKQHYHLETYCVLMKSLPSSLGGLPPVRYAVMEAVRPDDEAPPATTWVASTSAASEPILSPDDQALVCSSLEDLRRNVAEPEKAPFAIPGWIEELFRWVEVQIEPLGLALTGPFQQLNASPTFSLVRIETTGSAVWFKATGEPNKHELRISLALHRHFPDRVPRVLGVHSAWNGWLAQEVPGDTLGNFTAPSIWEMVASELARLQIDSIGKDAELLESQCRDLRLSRLRAQVDPFLARMADFMAAQEKQQPEALGNSELTLVRNQMREAAAVLEAAGLPDTLGQVDLNPQNIVIDHERCVFLDWAEGCVVTPFLTFEYLRQHFLQSSMEASAEAESTVSAAYLRPWRTLLSAHDLAQAVAVSPLIAVFAYAVADRRWSSSDTLHHPRQAGYFRSLTRRMYREATKVVERIEQCRI
jgi:hypothetical protein